MCVNHRKILVFKRSQRRDVLFNTKKKKVEEEKKKQYKVQEQQITD